MSAADPSNADSTDIATAEAAFVDFDAYYSPRTPPSAPTSTRPHALLLVAAGVVVGLALARTR